MGAPGTLIIWHPSNRYSSKFFVLRQGLQVILRALAQIAGNFQRSLFTYCNKVTNGCNCLFCVFISFFILHVSGSHKPIIRGISSCFLYTTIWFMWCLCCSSACACGLVCRVGFTVKPQRQTSPQAHAEPLVQENHHGTSTGKPPRQTSPQAQADEQHKHHMNQMVVYKKQLEIPLMMGL